MFVLVLICAVIFVNGWTDAPNAIVSVVCSKTLTMKRAVAIAALCNFAGVYISGKLHSAVADNIFKISGGSGSGLSAAMLSVIILAVGAWVFGIPTSESHALIAALCGAAVANRTVPDVRVLISTLAGLILSVGFGFVSGYAIYKSIRKRRFSDKITRRAQIFGAAFMAFMHGAQDGQKFIGLLLAASVSRYSVLTVSVIMALGTAVGGGRIIRNVGEKMVSLDLKQGVAADIAGGLSLFLSTALGMPVSTTHAKTASVMGCGYVDGGIEKKTASQMLAAWVITFPVCFGLGYLFTRLFNMF